MPFSPGSPCSAINTISAALQSSITFLPIVPYGLFRLSSLSLERSGTALSITYGGSGVLSAKKLSISPGSSSTP